RALSSLPKSALSSYLFVFLVSAVASLITWGLGLVVGGLLAREIAAQAREHGYRVHFPMLVASGFAGFVIWHMGYSGSGPLTAATTDSFISKQLGAPLPISETTFSTWNLIAIVATIVVVGLALYLVAPRGDDKIFELATDAREKLIELDDEVST